MTPETEQALRTKRDALNQQIEAERRKIPAEARRFVEQADSIIAEKNAGLDELVEARKKIDEEFGIGAADAAQRQAAERKQHKINLVSTLVRAEDDRLSAVENLEEATTALLTALINSLAAGKKVREAARDCGRPISSLGDSNFTNRLAARFGALMQKHLRAHLHTQRFGFIEFTGSSIFDGTDRMGRDKTTGWRLAEENLIAETIAAIRAEMEV